MPAEPLHDPRFHQRYLFSREGNAVRVEIWTEPGGGVTAEHFHPSLEERYEVLDGEVTFRLDGKEHQTGPGRQACREARGSPLL